MAPTTQTPCASRRVRVAVALMGVCAVVAACGQAPSPRLGASGAPEAAPHSAALSIIAQPADEPEFETFVPELLGFDPPEAPPPVLAMTDESPEASIAGTDESDGATAADVEANGATAEAANLENDDAGTADVAAPEQRSLSLPLPLPAVTGGDPLYDDPSEMLVRASARPFPTSLASADTTTRGLTRDAIRVGGVVSATLAGAPLRDGACLGAEARYRQANVNSELSKRIDFVDCHDDTGRADVSTAMTRALLDDDVFAIAPLSSVAFVSDEELTAAAVPHIGDGALPAFCGRATPFGFGIGGAVGCPVLDARGYAVLAEPVLTALVAGLGDLGSVLVLAPEGPDGAAVVASRRLEAELGGMPEPVAGPTIPDGGDGVPTSWGTIVREVLDADPDTVLLDGGITAGLPAALRSRGFAGEIVLVGTVDPLVIADDEARARLAPLTVVSHGLDLASRNSPGWFAIVAAAAGVDVAPDEIGLDFVRGYASADVFVRALATTPPPLSAESLVDTVNSGWWYPGIDGVTCGNWWPAAHYIATPCVSVARVEAASPVLLPLVDLVETAPQVRFGL